MGVVWKKYSFASQKVISSISRSADPAGGEGRREQLAQLGDRAEVLTQCVQRSVARLSSRATRAADADPGGELVRSAGNHRLERREDGLGVPPIPLDVVEADVADGVRRERERDADAEISAPRLRAAPRRDQGFRRRWP